MGEQIAATIRGTRDTLMGERAAATVSVGNIHKEMVT